ncbi:uncharacterized protein V6R79_002172 [Siganus canaliculatus]
MKPCLSVFISDIFHVCSPAADLDGDGKEGGSLIWAGAFTNGLHADQLEMIIWRNMTLGLDQPNVGTCRRSGHACRRLNTG